MMHGRRRECPVEVLGILKSLRQAVEQTHEFTELDDDTTLFGKGRNRYHDP